MQKRGISGVVSMIFIIFIVLVSISILWLFVQPEVVNVIGDKENPGEYTKFVTCTNVVLEVQSCSYGNSSMEINIKAGGGVNELSNIVFEFDNQNKFFHLNDSVSGRIPDEFGYSNVIFGSQGFTEAPNSVRVTGILINGEACQFDDSFTPCLLEPESESVCGNNRTEFGEQCDDGNLINGDGCSSLCIEEINNFTSCSDFNITVIPLTDYNESTCTRTRNGLVYGVNQLPSAGLRVVGTDWSRAAATGASLGRDIVQWYEPYDSFEPDANLNFTELDRRIAGYKAANMKVILTLRANHPNRSESSFDPNTQTLFQDDSWPKFDQEQAWKDYLQAVVKRYYRGDDGEQYAGALAAIQIGNEWGHQFTINSSYGRYQSGEEQEAILDLMEFSYSAVKEISPELPVIGFAVSGTPNWALGAGWNEDGGRYDGIYYTINTQVNGISIVRQPDIDQATIANIREVLTEGSSFYDYFDAHIYFQSPEEARYVANFIRDTWRQNGIRKGLVSTEFATPTYNYSHDLHSYNIKAAQAVAYHAGFDTIIWGNWNPSPGSPNLLQTSLKYSGGSGYQTKQIGNYTYFQSLSKNFNTVSREGDSFSFGINNNYNNFSLADDIPTYPSLYQCFDGLDNDDDGLIDSADSHCTNLGCNGGRQNITLGCIDPEGFSEDDWIFTF